MSTESNIIIDSGFEEWFDGRVLSYLYNMVEQETTTFVGSNPSTLLHNTFPLPQKLPIA